MFSTLPDSFEILTTAQTPKSNGRGRSTDNITHYGIQKLRELILELAVRGKLVPQDSNDEPALELLKRIDDEKERLFVEGKIKSHRALPEITEDEKPFLLPDNWEWAKLGNISVDIHYGYTASANADISKVRLLRITDIQNDSVNWESVPGCEIDENKICDYKLEDGDILIARTGGTIGKSYLVSSINVLAVFASYLIRVKHLEKTYPSYIKTFLGSQLYWQQLYESSMGTGQPNVNGQALKNMRIPIPPLSEQHRIVSKVNEVMALCDKLEQQQENNIKTQETLVNTLLEALTNVKDSIELQKNWQQIENNFDILLMTEESVDKLKQNILQLAVMGKLVPQDPNDEPACELLKKIAKEKEKLVKEGKIKKQKELPEIIDEEKPFDLPDKWTWTRLGTFTLVGTGATPSRDKITYFMPPEINWVTSGETRNEFITETDEKISMLAVKETNVSIYPEGTLIVAMYGQGKTRGQVSELMIPAGTNQACAAIVLLNKEDEHRKYLKLFFRKAYEELRSHSAGGAQPNLNVKKVSNTVVPIPPLTEQLRIVTKVEELFALCDKLKERIKVTEEIKVQLADVVVAGSI